MAKKAVKKAAAPLRKSAAKAKKVASKKATKDMAGKKPLFPGFFTDVLARTDPKIAKAIAA